MSTHEEVLECEHCGSRVPLQQLAEAEQKIPPINEAGLGPLRVRFRILYCLACKKPTFAETTEVRTSGGAGVSGLCKATLVRYPAPRVSLQSLPDLVSKSYRSTLKVRDVEPNACAVLAGRTLELICKHENAQGSSLVQKLTNLASTDRIPPVLSEMAQQLRQIRNLGAHAAEDEVSEDDIPVIIDFLEAILEYLYHAPKMVERVQMRLQRKSYDDGNSHT